MSDFPRPRLMPDGLVHLSTASFASVGCMPLIGGGGSSAFWPTINKAIFVPIRVAQPFTFTSFNAVIGTQSGNLDMGLYSADGTKIVSTGSTAVGTNLQTISVAATTIGPGLFYLALACNNTSVAFQFYTLSATAAVGLARALGLGQMLSAFPLPATATIAAITTAGIPLFGICGRSTV